jgi:hypothetical protein
MRLLEEKEKKKKAKEEKRKKEEEERLKKKEEKKKKKVEKKMAQEEKKIERDDKKHSRTRSGSLAVVAEKSKIPGPGSMGMPALSINEEAHPFG